LPKLAVPKLFRIIGSEKKLIRRRKKCPLRLVAEEERSSFVVDIDCY
jgi:hypothetical protein